VDPDRADYFVFAQQLALATTFVALPSSGHWSRQTASPVIGQMIFPGQLLRPPPASAKG